MLASSTVCSLRADMILPELQAALADGMVEENVARMIEDGLRFGFRGGWMSRPRFCVVSAGFATTLRLWSIVLFPAFICWANWNVEDAR